MFLYNLHNKTQRTKKYSMSRLIYLSICYIFTLWLLQPVIILQGLLWCQYPSDSRTQPRCLESRRGASHRGFVGQPWFSRCLGLLAGLCDAVQLLPTKKQNMPLTAARCMIQGQWRKVYISGHNTINEWFNFLPWYSIFFLFSTF